MAGPTYQPDDLLVVDVAGHLGSIVNHDMAAQLRLSQPFRGPQELQNGPLPKGDIVLGEAGGLGAGQ